MNAKRFRLKGVFQFNVRSLFLMSGSINTDNCILFYILLHFKRTKNRPFNGTSIFDYCKCRPIKLNHCA